MLYKISHANDLGFSLTVDFPHCFSGSQNQRKDCGSLWALNGSPAIHLQHFYYKNRSKKIEPF